MDSRQRELIDSIKSEAVHLDWHVAFGGKSKGNRHLFRVNKVVRLLLEKEGGDPFVSIASGWVHDVALAEGSDADNRIVAERTRTFLKQFDNLKQSEIEQIFACAACHEDGGNELSLEAKIVHDADVIDKSGLLGVIRHIWKMTNMLEKRILTRADDLDKLKQHLSMREKKVLTKTAQSIVKKLNLKRDEFFSDRSKALALMTHISEQAEVGFTSDKIAENLLLSNKGALGRGLKVQLSCRFDLALRPEY